MNLTQRNEKGEGVLSILLSCIEYFRNCKDDSGLNCFLSFIDELQGIINDCKYSSETSGRINLLLPAAEKLYLYIQNKDVTGATDLLEFTFYPLINEWVSDNR